MKPASIVIWSSLSVWTPCKICSPPRTSQSLNEVNRQVAIPKLARRRFLAAMATAPAAAVMARAADSEASDLHVSCQQVPWAIYQRREGGNFDLEAAISGAAQAGLSGFEPIIGSPAQVERLARLLEKHKLQIRSFYVEAMLHDRAKAEASAAKILQIAQAAKRLEARIILVRPLPLPKEEGTRKSDEQLIVQAEQLDALGAKLRELGLTLAWPNHAIELADSAREFHHMLAGTKPRHVSLCLDVHWAYRGTGNSQVAVFDLITLYARRLSVLHLRQSSQGVFTEAFGDGDIDYRRLHARLTELGAPSPHLVLDQAPEMGTPATMTTVEAHRKGVAYTRKIFGG
jgi:inosose dehydratase